MGGRCGGGVTEQRPPIAPYPCCFSPCLFLASFPTARFPVSMSLVGAAPQNIPRTWPPARGSPHSLPARQAVTWTTRECAAPAKMLLSARGAWGRSVWDGRWCPEPRWLEGHCPRHTLGHWEELPHSFGAALASHLGSARSREGFI